MAEMREGEPQGACSKRPLISRRAFLVAGAGVAVACAAGVAWENSRLLTTNFEVSSTRLPPAFDGFKIAQVSDYHNKRYAQDDAVARAVEATSPNMIAVTGDLIDRRMPNLELGYALIEACAGIAPVYYVPGNHENGLVGRDGVYEAISDLGAHVLIFAQEAVERDGEKILVSGVPDPVAPGKWLKGVGALAYEQASAGALDVGQWDSDDAGSDDSASEGGDGSADSSEEDEAATAAEDSWRAQSGTERLYTMLLSHRPEYFETYVGCGYDLVLSGHTHGGQICIPGIGAIACPNQGLFPKYVSGVYALGGTTMVISKGIGESALPVRVNCAPEIVSITLRRA